MTRGEIQEMGTVDNFIHLFAPLTANCRDFHNRWEQAKGLGPEGVSGCWSGEWTSKSTGHHGRLRCVINPVAPALWRMYFRAEYSTLFRACYATDFAVHQKDGGWSFSGGSDLGVLAGGEYSYSGHATLESLVCSYKSSRDQGEFKLRRFAEG
jgi:hypothetical protein